MPAHDGAAAAGKTLYLLRHAKSSWKDKALDDFDRPLNKRGRVAAKAIGEYMARHGIAPGQVLCSSAKRTRETMERVQEKVGGAVPVRFEKGIYMAEAPALLRRLKRLNDSLGSAMLVGHNPGLERLALLLATDSEDGLRSQLQAKFPTGSLAVIEAGVERWAELAPGCGRITALVRARDLVGE
jgi:phosphohistidine phosphatase